MLVPGRAGSRAARRAVPQGRVSALDADRARCNNPRAGTTAAPPPPPQEDLAQHLARDLARQTSRAPSRITSHPQAGPVRVPVPAAALPCCAHGWHDRYSQPRCLITELSAPGPRHVSCRHDTAPACANSRQHDTGPPRPSRWPAVSGVVPLRPGPRKQHAMA